MAAKIPAKYVLITLCIYHSIYVIGLLFFPDYLNKSYNMDIDSFGKKEQFITGMYYFNFGFLFWMLYGVWASAYRVAGPQAQSWLMLFSSLYLVCQTSRNMYCALVPSWADDMPVAKTAAIPNWVVQYILAICCLLATDFKQLHANLSKAPLYWGHFLLVLFCVVMALWGDIDRVGINKASGFTDGDFSSDASLALFKNMNYGLNGLLYSIGFISIGVLLSADHRWTLAVNRWYAVINFLVIGNNIASATHAADIGLADAALNFRWQSLPNLIWFALFYIPVLWADNHPEMHSLAARDAEGWDSVSSEE